MPKAPRRRLPAWARVDGRPLLLPALLLWVIALLLADVGHWAGADVLEYRAYAQAALHAPFLHHLPEEYPAPALAIFVLPLVLPFAYPWVFAGLVGAVLVGLLLSYNAGQPSGFDTEAARRLVIYLAVGAAVILVARYDIWAAACAFLAYRAARRHSWTAAWTWSSVGFLLKLFPAVLWPALLIAEFHRTRRVPKNRILWIMGSAALLIAIPAIFDPPALLSDLHWYLQRPPTIESFASGLSLLLDWHAWHFFYGYGSVNAVSPLVDPMATGIMLLAVAGIIAALWAQAKGRLSFEVSCLLSLTLLVLGMKVVSAQYLIWLMPFWAAYRLRGPWVLACAANTIVFPFSASVANFGYISVHGWAETLTLMFLFRDVMIAAGTIGWLRHVLRSGRAVESELGPDVTVEPVLAPPQGSTRSVGLLGSRAASGT
jgi:hypothetical protein